MNLTLYSHIQYWPNNKIFIKINNNQNNKQVKKNNKRKKEILLLFLYNQINQLHND